MAPIVVAGLCTCRRPLMLRACLDSLAAQVPPPDIDMHIVVVDNEARPASADAVRAFAATCRFPVHYVHEPRRGIAQARNALIDKTLALNADWLAMLDDDETAAPGWIAGLMAAEHRGTPILQGYREWVYPNPLPFWAFPAQEPLYGDGEDAESATTNNIRIGAAVLHAGYRFHEAFGLTGGEDYEFTRRARLAGFAIRRTPHAVTYEHMLTERLTLRAQMSRAAWKVCSGLQSHQTITGTRMPLRARLLLAGGYLASGLRKGLGAILTAPVAPLLFRRRFLGACNQLARGYAVVADIRGRPLQPYRHIIGE